MRKVVLYIAISLDGYIARRSGEIDWLFSDQDYGYTKFLGAVDTIVMGRKTYEQVLRFGEYPYKGLECFVYSRKLVGRNENVSFVSEPPASFITKLKQRPGKDIWLVGGAELASECVKHDLIDEYIISVHPIILGQGIQLFPPPLPELWLELIDAESFSSGLVQLSYQRKRDENFLA